jgi:hypothetical protein
MKRWTSWVTLIVIVSLLTACGNAGNYVKDHYPLISADGKGNNLSKVYSAEGKTVPVVASELAAKEPPKEKSKESPDQMFLLYSDKVINIQKDPKDSNNSLVQIDSIEYAKNHYDSSFLQGYLAAALLQSVMGGGWFGNNRSNEYRGYTQTPTYSSDSSKSTQAAKEKTPVTSDRTGTFSTNRKSVTSNSDIGSSSFGSSSTNRKNDGSTQNRITKPSSSKPSTSSRSGSFSRRK